MTKQMIKTVLLVEETKEPRKKITQPIPNTALWYPFM
jgi:hypothetical protein